MEVTPKSYSYKRARYSSLLGKKKIYLKLLQLTLKFVILYLKGRAGKSLKAIFCAIFS